MPGYISAIIDKPALQSLSTKEVKWLFHHFRVNIPPVLFSEVLGDLAKTRGLSTGSAAGDVRMLAQKIASHSVYLNAAHYDLIASELNGDRIDMTGQPIVSNAESARMPDGSMAYLSIRLHFKPYGTDGVPENLMRWNASLPRYGEPTRRRSISKR